jgi:hypothetical protein
LLALVDRPRVAEVLALVDRPAAATEPQPNTLAVGRAARPRAEGHPYRKS